MFAVLLRQRKGNHTYLSGFYIYMPLAELQIMDRKQHVGPVVHPWRNPLLA